jgi:hypothetical protein
MPVAAPVPSALKAAARCPGTDATLGNVVYGMDTGPDPDAGERA